MKKTIQNMIIIAILCSVPSAVWAQEEPPAETRKMGMMREGPGAMGGGDVMSSAWLNKILETGKISTEIGLSEEQKAALKDGLYKFQRRQIELNAEMQKSALEQAQLMVAEKMDEEALMATIEKSGAIHTELAKLRMQPLLLIKKNLSPEQIEKAKDLLREQARKRMAEGRSDKIREQGQKGREPGDKMRESGQKEHAPGEFNDHGKDGRAPWRERIKERISDSEGERKDPYRRPPEPKEEPE